METYEPYMRRINKLENGIAASIPVLLNLKEYMANPRAFDPQYDPAQRVAQAINLLQQSISGTIREPDSGTSTNNPA